MAKINHENKNSLSKLKRDKNKDFQLRAIVIKSQFDSICFSCKNKIKKGKEIKFFPLLKKALHKQCKLPWSQNEN